nr:unnamed protein product [Callosobruchus chinensis]
MKHSCMISGITRRCIPVVTVEEEVRQFM